MLQQIHTSFETTWKKEQKSYNYVSEKSVLFSK